MKVFFTIKELKDYYKLSLNKSESIGFVPTMGALHSGHISLIEKSMLENDLTVCSIFVNPIQFDNREDFEKYPVQSKEDIELLNKTGCDVVFMPSVDEMYSEPVNIMFDFGILEKVMEGASREGHFNGVAIVVKKLFDIVRPTNAYFGEKDYQQLQIIQHMVRKDNIPVKIIDCPLIRERDGLAMSSRNLRLTSKERIIAPEIYRTLIKCSELSPTYTVQQLRKYFLKTISKHPDIKVDYFEIADEITLKPLSDWSDSENPRLFVAVYIGNVRLIDNMKIIL